MLYTVKKHNLKKCDKMRKKRGLGVRGERGENLILARGKLESQQEKNYLADGWAGQFGALGLDSVAL